MVFPPGLFPEEEEETNTSLADVNNSGFTATELPTSKPTDASKFDPSATDASTIQIIIEPAIAYYPARNFTDRVFPAIDWTWVQFTWGNTKGVNVLRATWQYIDEKNSTQSIRYVDYHESSANTTKFPSNGNIASAEHDQSRMFFATDSRLIVPLSVIAPTIEGKSPWDGKDMQIAFDWKQGDRTGSTYSGVFTVVGASQFTNTFNEAVSRIKSKRSESIDLNGASADGGAEPTSTSSTGPTAGATGPDSTSTSGTTSSNGGLGTPAIVGIVIGVLFGVAIIGGLIWFFLRRRRHDARSPDGTYDHGNSPHEYIGDKETHARVTESPHSPYSDDGQGQRHLNVNGPEMDLPVSTVSPTEGHAFVSYTEQDHTPIASRSVENINRDGPHLSNPNLNSNVSHLIEDGMTEDEIRRLEEEERALDAAIEQAGQGQGQRR